MGPGTGFPGAEEQGWRAWVGAAASWHAGRSAGGKNTAAQQGLACSLSSPWHGQMPTAHPTSRRALGPGRGGGHENATTSGGGRG